MNTGREWSVVKLLPDGSPAARYAATERPAPAGWVAVRAVWGYGTVDIGHLTFEPGDVLDEYFSLERYYNAFAIYRSDGRFAGWYCNVTYPTRITGDEIHWQDLYLDILVLPGGRVFVLDEDELETSGLKTRDPELHATIVRAKDELLALYERGAYPFSEVAR